MLYTSQLANPFVPFICLSANSVVLFLGWRWRRRGWGQWARFRRGWEEWGCQRKQVCGICPAKQEEKGQRRWRWRRRLKFDLGLRFVVRSSLHAFQMFRVGGVEASNLGSFVEGFSESFSNFIRDAGDPPLLCSFMWKFCCYKIEALTLIMRAVFMVVLLKRLRLACASAPYHCEKVPVWAWHHRLNLPLKKKVRLNWVISKSSGTIFIGLFKAAHRASVKSIYIC